MRRDAFEHLVAFPDHLRVAKIDAALLDLLEKENVESLTSKEDLFEDDDYVAYQEAVVAEIQKLAVNTHSRRAWHLLVQGRYNADSQFGRWLAMHEEALLEVEALITSKYAGQRMIGVYLAAAMAANGVNTSMGNAKYEEIHRRVRWHVRHDVLAVVAASVEGLVLMGDPTDAPLLEAFAQCKAPFYKNQALEAAQTLRRAGKPVATAAVP